MSDGRFAVMAVDPGGVTGIACGVFLDDGVGGRAAVLRAHRVEAWEVEGSAAEQSWEIASEFLDWVAEANLNGVALSRIWLVLEAFRLRTGLADLTGVEVAAGIRCLLMPRAAARWAGLSRVGDVGWNVVEQEPADAKRIVTSARLRHWGLWAVGRGSNHKRDALRHLALRVGIVLDGGSMSNVD